MNLDDLDEDILLYQSLKTNGLLQSSMNNRMNVRNQIQPNQNQSAVPLKDQMLAFMGMHGIGFGGKSVQNRQVQQVQQVEPEPVDNQVERKKTNKNIFKVSLNKKYADCISLSGEFQAINPDNFRFKKVVEKEVVEHKEESAHEEVEVEKEPVKQAVEKVCKPNKWNLFYKEYALKHKEELKHLTSTEKNKKIAEVYRQSAK